MFEALSHYALQQYWWFLVSVLGAILVFLMFVQGGQTLLFCLTKDENEKSLMVNSLGRKWELTFTTLVTFGGAMFAAFPKFYSTSFGGAYWVWMAILFCFIIQAVSYEFRKKPNNFLGAKTYEWFLFINGSLGVILIGTAVGTFFNGADFSVNALNLSRWENGLRGLEAVFTFHNVALGLTIFFLARVLGLLYFINNINNDSLIEKARKKLPLNAVLFLVFFLYFAIQLLLMKGFAVDPATKIVYFENYKYLKNFLQMPVVLVIFLAGVILVLLGLFLAIFKKSRKAIWHTGIGTVLTVLALFLIAGWNNTSFYPSLADLQSSLTIENSSSSKFTLTVMSYVSLLIPFVIAYIYYVWKAMDKKKLETAELEDKNEHIY